MPAHALSGRSAVIIHHRRGQADEVDVPNAGMWEARPDATTCGNTGGIKAIPSKRRGSRRI
jgi:hypothetical protein